MTPTPSYRRGPQGPPPFTVEGKALSSEGQALAFALDRARREHREVTVEEYGDALWIAFHRDEDNTTTYRPA